MDKLKRNKFENNIESVQELKSAQMVNMQPSKSQKNYLKGNKSTRNSHQVDENDKENQNLDTNQTTQGGKRERRSSRYSRRNSRNSIKRVPMTDEWVSIKNLKFEFNFFRLQAILRIARTTSPMFRSSTQDSL